LKVFIFFYMLVFITSVASAEVYKWQDENGIHYTDSPASVPDKYRDKVFAETSEQIKNASPPARIGVTQQNNFIAAQKVQAAVYQANLEQKKHAAEAMKQQQISAKIVENGFQSLAKFLVIWIMLGLFLFVIWIVTIVDIVRSEFISPSNKTVWMLLVILIPLLGMLLYMIFGSSQKCNSVSYKEKQRLDFLAQLNPSESKTKDFII